MWKYYEQPPGLRLPSAYALTPTQEHALRARGWGLLLRGEDDPYLLEEVAVDELGLDLGEKDVGEILSFLRDARRAQQDAWGPDAGRTSLTRAFEAL